MANQSADADIHKIIALVKARCPDAVIDQLQVVHPGADDDGLWFFAKPGGVHHVAIESTYGNCPFIVENTLDNDCLHTDSIDLTVAAVVDFYENRL